jgi:hypothetical protein
MNYLKIIILFTLILQSEGTFSQDLSSHQWKDRLIMVLASDTALAAYHDQLQIFHSDSSGMKERKLVLYKITPDQYQIGTDSHQWIRSGTLYKSLRKTDANLEVILIGLDGTIKLRQSGIITTEKLFATIDAMPMRRSEMRRKN